MLVRSHEVELTCNAALHGLLGASDRANIHLQATPPVDVENGDKGLKRKFLERGTSQPPEGGDSSKGPTEPLKRPRDDTENDDNPRETKRPSPPPEQKSPKSPKKTLSTPKLVSTFYIFCLSVLLMTHASIGWLHGVCLCNFTICWSERPEHL